MFLFVRPAENLIPYKGNCDGHQRRDKVEETVWQIFQSGNFQHHGLRHTASVPRYKHGGDRGGIFGGTAQQASLEAHILVKLLVYVAGEHNAEILVACGHVGKETCTHGGSYQRAAAADATG